MRLCRALLTIALTLASITSASAQKPRENDLKLPIGGTPGKLDAITDIAGIEVGHTTLISGAGPLVVGKGPVRTGVTVVHPRGKANTDPVFGAWFTLNGNGEMTGTTWLQEGGYLEGPIAITNTHSVGVVRDAILQWRVGKPGMQPWGLPVVAETYDGGLNDINGFHVKPEHVIAALDGAKGGAVPEGVVGAGTGMTCLGFKGGIGTASRLLTPAQGGYTVGVLVQCNFGSRRDLRIAGVPVGEEITDLTPCIAGTGPLPAGRRRCTDAGGGADDVTDDPNHEQGSIIVIVATDAPLLPHQLQRLVKRVALGIGRQGGFGGNGSGDIFVAFSTANAKSGTARDSASVMMLSNDIISPLFQATAWATEAAITNALLAAETTTGANDLRIYAMPRDRMLAAMRKYGRLP
jgi:L-aminopeptidase/D-esterase-like protein